MTRYWYDTEFLEDGETIALISIGIVAEDGREYYAVNRDMPKHRISKHTWLMENVVPSLPRLHGDARLHAINSWFERRTNPILLEYNDRAIKPKERIAREVEDFFLDVEHRDRTGMLPDVELWAWYGAYDHVALAWLFGPMSDMPEGIPYFTNDLKQEATRLGLNDSDLPEQPGGVHNALADARHNKVRHDWLIEYERQQQG